MQSGVLNKDNLSNVFRGLSQKRQQGTMEITLPESVMKIHFVQGKIVDVLDNLGDPCTEVAGILIASERLPAGWSAAAERYSDLLAAASASGGDALTDSVFKMAVKKRILDKLYALQLGSGAYYTFKVEMVDYDRELCPQISIGQLLLDYVALETDGPQFAALFPPDKVVRKGPAPKSGLSEEEEMIYDILGDEGLSLDDIGRLSLLSRYHIQDSLIALHKGGLVEVGEAAKPSGADLSEMDLDSSIDAIFESETGMSISGGERGAGAGGGSETEPDRVSGDSAVSSVPLSSALLQSNMVPLGLTAISLVAVVAVPLLRWKDLLAYFMQ